MAQPKRGGKKDAAPAVEWYRSGVGSPEDRDPEAEPFETWEAGVVLQGEPIYRQAVKVSEGPEGEQIIEPQWESEGVPALELGPDGEPILVHDGALQYDRYRPEIIDRATVGDVLDRFKDREIEAISLSREGGVSVRIVAEPGKTVEELEAEVERLRAELTKAQKEES